MVHSYLAEWTPTLWPVQENDQRIGVQDSVGLRKMNEMNETSTRGTFRTTWSWCSQKGGRAWKNFFWTFTRRQCWQHMINEERLGDAASSSAQVHSKSDHRVNKVYSGWWMLIGSFFAHANGKSLKATFYRTWVWTRNKKRTLIKWKQRKSIQVEYTIIDLYKTVWWNVTVAWQTVAPEAAFSSLRMQIPDTQWTFSIPRKEEADVWF